MTIYVVWSIQTFSRASRGLWGGHSKVVRISQRLLILFEDMQTLTIHMLRIIDFNMEAARDA